MRFFFNDLKQDYERKKIILFLKKQIRKNRLLNMLCILDMMFSNNLQCSKNSNCINYKNTLISSFGCGGGNVKESHVFTTEVYEKLKKAVC